MKKTLLNDKEALKIIDRLRSLKETNTSKWGNMSLNEMLNHCKVVNIAILESNSANKKPTLRQRLLRTLVLYLRQRLPKGIKTDPKFLVQEQQDLNFETERNKLIHTISRFVVRKKPLETAHPFFGKLNTKQWGRFAWIHADHHLRQFGV